MKYDMLDPYGAFLTRHEQAGGSGGPLAGLRLCVKDNIEIAGEPFTAGHPLFADRLGQYTAPTVTQLLSAGAAFVGMTATDDGGFGMATPSVSNPVYPGLTVGGSSGGAAAAIAAGLADIGLGTDTGGSCRVPAACTGIFGFKPTYGLISTEGVFPLAPNLDSVGLIARNATLLDRTLDALGVSAPPTIPDRLTIAIDRQAPPFSDPAIMRTFEEQIAILNKAGHQIVQADLPDRLEVGAAFGVIVVREASDVYRDLSEGDRARLGATAHRTLAHTPPLERVVTARKQASEFTRRYGVSLETADVLISPTLYVDPPAQGHHSIEAGDRKWPLIQVFSAGTCFANLAGMPALSMPLSGPHRPFNLHLSARRNADRFLLQLAERLATDGSLPIMTSEHPANR